mgnify:FL=1|jgi:hypothetical protein
MTFFGFDEKTVDAERQKLYDSFRKAEEFDKLPPEERAKHFFLCGGGFCRVGCVSLTRSCCLPRIFAKKIYA